MNVGTLTSQQTCTANGNISTVQIYLTEQRSGMRWPVKLKGFKTAIVSSDEAPPDARGAKGLRQILRIRTGHQCTDTIVNVDYMANTKVSNSLP